jgi:hypothetical protein
MIGGDMFEWSEDTTNKMITYIALPSTPVHEIGRILAQDQQTLASYISRQYKYSSLRSLVVKYKAYDALYYSMDDSISYNVNIMSIVLHENAEAMIKKHNMLSDELTMRCIIAVMEQFDLDCLPGFKERMVRSMIDDHGWVKCRHIPISDEVVVANELAYLVHPRDYKLLQTFDDVIMFIHRRFGTGDLHWQYRSQHNSCYTSVDLLHVGKHIHNGFVYESMDDDTVRFIPWSKPLQIETDA